MIYTLVHPASAVLKVPVSCNPDGTTIGTNTSTDIVCMQDITSTNKSSVLASMTNEAQYTLIDKRDEKSYTIAKLADGKVWMTQNLDLDLDSNTTYTNEDTDLGWNTSTSQYDTASWTPTRSTYGATSDQTHEWCQGGIWNTQYGFCDNNNTPESYDPGNLYWNEATSDYSDWDGYYSTCDSSTSTPTCTGTSPLATYVATSGTPQYHLGNYYNWPAAIASNDASVYGAWNDTTGEYESQEANQSICPAGWTLPYSDLNTLWIEYGFGGYSFSDITNLTGAPLYFAPSGFFAGILGDAGYGGYSWFPVPDGDEGANNVYFDVSGLASLANGNDRYVGYPIRCLLR